MPKDTDLPALIDLWPHLTPWQRKLILLRAWFHALAPRPERRRIRLQVHWIGGDRRRFDFLERLNAFRLPAIHATATLAILIAYPPRVPLYLIPITWAASLGFTMIIWAMLNAHTQQT